jgi:hypothetical protein
MGTDGVFDNLYGADILHCIQGQVSSGFKLKSVQEASECIAKTASVKSHLSNYFSPYQKAARIHGIEH